MISIFLAVVGLCIVSFAFAKGIIYVWETYQAGKNAQKVYWFSKD